MAKPKSPGSQVTTEHPYPRLLVLRVACYSSTPLHAHFLIHDTHAARTCTDTHTHTHTHTPAGSYARTHVHSHSLAHTCTHTHTRTGTRALALSRANTRARVQLLHPPLLVLNNFGGDDVQSKLMTTTFQSMFPSIDVSTVELAALRRVVLITRDSDGGLHLRHYELSVKPAGVSKSIKSLLKKGVPDLSKFNDVSDFVLNGGQGSVPHSPSHPVLLLSPSLSTRTLQAKWCRRKWCAGWIHLCPLIQTHFPPP
jgi:hypothetical protein